MHHIILFGTTILESFQNHYRNPTFYNWVTFLKKGNHKAIHHLLNIMFNGINKDVFLVPYISTIPSPVGHVVACLVINPKFWKSLHFVHNCLPLLCCCFHHSTIAYLTSFLSAGNILYHGLQWTGPGWGHEQWNMPLHHTHAIIQVWA